MMDIARILSALPHRYPFLLVDRVVEVVKGERIHAYKNLTFNEHFFQGHFPGAPVMPGVLQLEALAQAGGLLAYETTPWDSSKLVLFMSMDKVKFRRMVTPGDRLKKIQGRTVLNVEDVERFARRLKPGDEVKLTVERGGETKTITFKTAEGL